MKISFQIELNKVAKKIFFPNALLKEKCKILEILLESCRYILYNDIVESSNAVDKIIVNVNKMNRIFFISETKMYSINFPFNIILYENSVSINYKNVYDVDSQTISNLLTIVKSKMFDSDNCLDFIDPIIDLEKLWKVNYWALLRDLLILEDGYIRYDKDEDGYRQANKKGQPHRHPLNHIDVFYLSKNTFKLGLIGDFFPADFIDVVDINTDCKYLKS